MLLLGLESSCDDTAAALVRQLPGQRALVLSSVVVGQTELHASFGGVVPEIAARAHAEKLDLCVEKALAEAALTDTAPIRGYEFHNGNHDLLFRFAIDGKLTSQGWRTSAAVCRSYPVGF